MNDHRQSEQSVAAGPEVEDRLLAFADRLRRGSQDDEVQEEQPEVWVTFRLAHRSYALPVTHVREYAPVGQITRVPGAPPAVCGAASLRGHTIPVVDLKKSLGLSDRPARGDDHVLVVEQRGRLIGLLIDRIDQVVKLLPSRIKDAPTLERVGASNKILGFYDLDETTLILLSAANFLSQSDDSNSQLAATPEGPH